MTFPKNPINTTSFALFFFKDVEATKELHLNEANVRAINSKEDHFFKITRGSLNFSFFSFLGRSILFLLFPVFSSHFEDN